MRRREFIALLGGALASPALARAQEPTKLPRVGVLTPATSDQTPIFDGFRKGLRDLGYVEGTTIILDFRFAKGNPNALPALAKNLVNSPIDVIVTDGTSATLDKTVGAVALSWQ